MSYKSTQKYGWMLNTTVKSKSLKRLVCSITWFHFYILENAKIQKQNCSVVRDLESLGGWIAEAQ